MDIIKIKAEVYRLEQKGKRLPILHYLQDVWQQEPPSEDLTVLALQGFSAGYYFLGAEKVPHEQAVSMADVFLSQSGIYLFLYVW